VSVGVTGGENDNEGEIAERLLRWGDLSLLVASGEAMDTGVGAANVSECG